MTSAPRPPGPLPLRRLGRTGHTVSAIGLGLAALGRPAYITLDHGRDLPAGRDVESMERHCHAVLDTAWEAGIRYLDAARSYGLAELFVASWLRGRRRAPGDPMVGSKWGYTYTADWRVDVERHEVKDHGVDALRRQLEESRDILGEHLLLYQIHSATPDSGVLEDDEVLAALAALRGEGIAIGVTVSGPSQAQTLARALEARVDGEPVFDAVQATWNLLLRDAEPVLAEAHQAGIAVIVKEALANGRLTERNQKPGFAARTQLLRDAAERLHTTVDALALAAAVQRPWATVVLSGAASVEQLRSNLGTLTVNWDERAESELAGLVEEPGRYWETRAALPWN